MGRILGMVGIPIRVAVPMELPQERLASESVYTVVERSSMEIRRAI
jgi:hypothetical protein